MVDRHRRCASRSTRCCISGTSAHASLMNFKRHALAGQQSCRSHTVPMPPSPSDRSRRNRPATTQFDDSSVLTASHPLARRVPCGTGEESAMDAVIRGSAASLRHDTRPGPIAARRASHVAAQQAAQAATRSLLTPRECLARPANRRILATAARRSSDDAVSAGRLGDGYEKWAIRAGRVSCRNDAAEPE